MWGKFGDSPDCAGPMIMQLGKPRLCIPCSVAMPPAHFCDSVLPSVPCNSNPERLAKLLDTSNPVAKMRQSSGYSRPLATTAVSVIDSTPRPRVSTSVTFGRLNTSRYSSWKHGRLQKRLNHGCSACAVAGSRTMRCMRSRTCTIFSISACSSSASGSADGSRASMPRTARASTVQPSPTRSSCARSPASWAVKLSTRRCCHPGVRLAAQAASVGLLSRGSTEDGVRWNTYRCCADSASGGTHWIAVAPVPMIPTRLSRSRTSGSVALPPVYW